MMKRVRLTIAGTSEQETVEGWAERIGDNLWVHLDGRTFSFETTKKGTRRSARSARSAAPGTLAAPTPGKVIKISVAEGQMVGRHDVVIVIEAMKMEYTLKADVAGTVASIACKAGDQVALGQVLAKITPAE